MVRRLLATNRMPWFRVSDDSLFPRSPFSVSLRPVESCDVIIPQSHWITLSWAEPLHLDLLPRLVLINISRLSCHCFKRGLRWNPREGRSNSVQKEKCRNLCVALAEYGEVLDSRYRYREIQRAPFRRLLKDEIKVEQIPGLCLTVSPKFWYSKNSLGA